MYYIVYGFFYLFSLLPLPVLYLFSDLAYFLIYYVIRYRKEVVLSNLKQAFPEKTEKERRKIAKKFYHNFTDNFIEVIKLVSASPRYIKKRFAGDPSMPNEVYEKGQRCQLLLAHTFNWEWGCLALPTMLKHLFLVVYMPIASKTMDKLFIRIRARTGAALIPATDMRKTILPYRNKMYMLALVADQNPGHPANAYWFNFFGRPTPFVKAPESGARRGNTPVLFCQFTRERRGYYKVIFEMGEENPSSLKEGELTERYVSYLHRIIREQPENWLWSHRRWKWEWKPEYGKVIE